jgi:DNA-binding response OmpR family regulator
MRVLVIEDDAGLRAQLVENLKDAGNVVDAAADGDEASTSTRVRI